MIKTPLTARFTLTANAGQTTVIVGNGPSNALLVLRAKAPQFFNTPPSVIPAKTDLVLTAFAPLSFNSGLNTTHFPGKADLSIAAFAGKPIERIGDGPDRAVFTLTCFAPKPVNTTDLAVPKATLTLTAKAPTTVTPITTVQVKTDLSLVALAPVGLLEHFKSPSIATLTLASKVGGTAQPVTVVTSLAGYTITPTTPFKSIGIVRTPAKASLTLIDKAPVIFIGNIVVEPGTATLSIVGVAGNGFVSQLFVPGTADLSIAGIAPESSIDNPIVTPAPAILSLVANAPRRGVGHIVKTASLVVVDTVPITNNTKVLTPSPGNLVFKGVPPVNIADNVEKLTKVANLVISGKPPSEIDGSWVVQGEDEDIWTLQDEDTDTWNRAA